jgi:hypothetical protein
MDSVRDTACAVGCPIRRSRDQRSLASPPGFSQRATSFIASWRQGIHQMPLPQRLIAKPVARRDKPRSDDRGQTTEDGMSAASASRRREQRVSHEDTLRKLSADNRQLKASLTPSSRCQRPSRRHPCRQNLLLPIQTAPLALAGFKACRAVARAGQSARLRPPGFGAAAFSRFASEGWWR